MSISASVQQYLLQERIPYEVVVHAPTWGSAHSAESPHIAGERLAKPVLLEDEVSYLMALIPASRKLDLPTVCAELHRKLALSDEHAVAMVFEDCAVGAIPPVPGAYRLDSVVDRALVNVTDIYLEGGDHRSLIHLRGQEFRKVIADAPQRDITRPL